MSAFPAAKSCDIMLLLEGTFPYVSGGVSSWVNQIIRGFPEYTFGICFLGSRREDYGDMRYPLPANVVHLECHYLYDFPPPPLVQASGGDAAAFERSRKLHDALRNPANKAETAELIRASIADLRDDAVGDLPLHLGEVLRRDDVVVRERTKVLEDRVLRERRDALPRPAAVLATSALLGFELDRDAELLRHVGGEIGLEADDVARRIAKEHQRLYALPRPEIRTRNAAGGGRRPPGDPRRGG
mgnify:CR=1 FL=1